MTKKNMTHAIGHATCAWLTADDDRALLLLSTGERVTIAAINAGMGAFAARILRSMARLCKRQVAVFVDGGYQLDAH